MDIQISLIGLGQIGSSFGLALEPYSSSITRVGFDRDPGVANRAREIGAVDQTASSMLEAIQGSDMVLLALPMHEIKSAMQEISGSIKKGAVVLDTAPVKQTVLAWSENHLSDTVSYVGLTPVINPEYLHEDHFGIQSARADLFDEGMVAVVTGNGVGNAVIKRVTNLIGMVGAEPFFVDPSEIDGLMTMTFIMPRLLAASLLRATLNKPGWQDGRKIAGRAFARVSGPITPVDEPASLASAVMNNKDNVNRVIDDVIQSLQEFKKHMDEGDGDELLELLEQVQQGRYEWWRNRTSPLSGAGEGQLNNPSANIFQQLFGISRPNSPRGGHDS